MIQIEHHTGAVPPDTDATTLYLECWGILTPYRAQKKMGTMYRAGFEQAVAEGRLHVVRDEAGLLIGFMQVSLKKRLNCISVDRIAVRGSNLRQGVGTRLMEIAKDIANEKKIPLRLRVANTNPGAIAFYKTFGMTVVETSSLTSAMQTGVSQ